MILCITQVRAQTTTATFSPSGDAVVLSETADVGNNYGSDPRLLAWSWTNGPQYNYRSYIQFNTSAIPAAANVCSAYLSFYTTADNNMSGYNQPNSFYLKRVTSGAWTNSGITWTNQPNGFSTTDIVSCPSFTVPTGTLYTVNVTTQVQAMVSSPSTNYGWVIMLQNEANVYASLGFASSDNTTASLRPFLTVVYSPIIATTTPASRCGTGAVTLGATANTGTVNWYTASTGGTAIATGNSYTTPSISSTTTYYVDATSSGCTTASRTAVVATVNAIPTITVSPASPSICAGIASTLTASGGSTYTWSPGTGLSATVGTSVTANPSVTTNYTVSGASSGGCTSTTSFSVTVNSLPTVSVSPGSATLCVGSNTALTASGATTYSWSPATGLNTSVGASVTANPTITTTYTLSGTNATGCIGTKTVAITVNALPTLSVSPAAPAVCVGSSVTVTASGATSYTWSPANGLSNTASASVTANPTITTTYTLSGINASNCISTQQLIFTVNPLPIITSSPNSLVVLSGKGPVITAGGASTYTWSPTHDLSATNGSTVTASPPVTSNYTITGTSVSGCVNSTAVVVNVELWKQGADTGNAPISYPGFVGIGNPNPQNPLDVTGNARVAGNVDATSLSFQGGQSQILYAPADSRFSGQTNIGGSVPRPIHYPPCIIPQNPGSTLPWNTTVQDKLTIWTPNGVNSSTAAEVLTIANDYSGAIIDLAGTAANPANTNGVLLLNYYCGKDVSICGNSSNGGGSNSAGGVVNVGQNFLVGGPALDIATALNVKANGANAVKVQDVNNNTLLNVASTGSMNMNVSGATGSIPVDALVITDVSNSNSINFKVKTSGQVYANVSGATGSTPVDALVITDVSNSNTINFKIKTSGQVYAREVIVKSVGLGFPDYVFDKSYKLTPLEEVKKYIESNHHLPNMPTAKEVEKDGANLGEIQRVSVEKIEELTLYMIEMKKELEKSQKEIEKSNREIEKLKQENTELKTMINHK